jgi:hypothetical protein
VSDLCDDQLARRLPDGTVVVRTTAARVSIAIDSLVSADDHECNLTAEFDVIASNAPADRQLLAEDLLKDSDALSTSQIADALRMTIEPSVRQTLSALAGREIPSPEAQSSLTTAVRRAADRWAFRGGLVIESVQIKVHSPTLERESLHRRRVAELERAGKLAERFRALREANPDVPLAFILEGMDPTYRGEILRAAMRSGDDSTTETPVLLIAAGDKLLRASIHRRGDEELQVDCENVPISADLGPFRSLSSIAMNGTTCLAIGARRGVAVIDPLNPSTAAIFRSTEQTERGFHRVIVDEQHGRLLASHSDLGLIAWSIRNGNVGREIHRWPADRATELLRLPDGQLLLGEQRRIQHLRGDGMLRELIPFDGDLIALANDTLECFAMLADGRTLAFGKYPMTRSLARPATVTAAAAWRDSPIGFRLIRATESIGGVEAFGMDDDSLVLHFTSPHPGSRIVAASKSLVAAVSGDRQRVSLWNAWNTDSPAGEVYVGAIARHRISDLLFLPPPD